MKKLLVAVIALTIFQDIRSFAPTNLCLPYDTFLHMQYGQNKNYFFLGTTFEQSIASKGWSNGFENVDPLQIYDNTQATLPMLSGYKDISNAAYSAVNGKFGSISDDGQFLGHMQFSGSYAQTTGMVQAHVMIPEFCTPGQFAVSLTMPFVLAKVDNVTLTDLTDQSTNATSRSTVQTNLTNPAEGFAPFIQRLAGIDLSSWSASGLGDTTLMIEWINSYRQERKEGLSSIRLHARAGMSFPTGLQKDEDKAFSFAFGNDGAWSIPAGFGFAIEFKNNVRIGADLMFEMIFQQDKIRRLKTDPHQTEFLLPNKGLSTKQHGLSVKTGFYLQGYHIWYGLSLKAAYEYCKHDQDVLRSKDTFFKNTIINTAQSLNGWSFHNMLVSLAYDCFDDAPDLVVKPQANLFCKLPLGGMQVINAYTLGGQLGINF